MLDEVTIDQYSHEIDFPSVCPHCSKIGHPLELISDIIDLKDKRYRVLVVMFQCPSCERVYCGEYSSFGGTPFKPISIYPSPNPQLDIPSQIEEYFPDFYQIYDQSAFAEVSGLDKIAGMCYRKAIEFLIKDYLVQKYPNFKDDIQKEPLAASIKRIEFPSIKALATAATWLGNDQTHVIQKHPDYNVQDIKAFTVALCHLIISEKIAEKALKLINK